MPTLLLSGDVMTARGVDQILVHPVDPELHEGYLTCTGSSRQLEFAKNGRQSAQDHRLEETAR